MGNKTFYQMLGYNSDEIQNLGVMDIHPAEEVNHSADQFEKLLKKEIAVSENIPVKRKDGSIFIADIRAFLISLAEKTYLAGVFRDITERKQAEEALRVSEARFSTVFRASPIGMSIARLVDDQYVDVNEAFLSLFGYTREEALKHTSLQLQTWATPEERDKVVKILREQGSVRNIEAQYRRKSGEIWTALASAEVVEVAGERYILALLQDITERKQAEEALNKSEAKFRNLVENASIGIFRTKIDGSRVLDANPKLCEILGLTREEFVGQPSAIAWAYPERREEMVRMLREKGSISNYEIDIRTKSGEIRTVIMSMMTYPTLGYLEGGLQDITERKQAEEEIKISKERLLFATEGANLGIWNWDTITGELIWSNKCKTLFGIPLDEAMSYQRFSDALHPDDRERTDMAVKDALDNHKDYDIEYRSLWPDGSIHWLAAKGRGYYDKTGKALRLEGIVLDITKRKIAEQYLQKTLDDLKRSNEELEQFAYVASHDLQEPLRMVSSYTQLLERRYKDKLDKDAEDFINFAVDGATRMQRLINDLLDYSRVTTRGKKFEQVDIQSVVGQVFANLQNRIEESHAIITQDDLPVVEADESQMIRLFQNLIDNALKFRSDTPPRVHISAHKEGGFHVFTVSDNGIGIDSQHTDRIFLIFQRLGSSRDYPGTGIGLAICKRIVERHGGKIWFESKVGNGSKFFFTIPIR
jgi:PAS domain S-box-containing protein